MKALLKTATQQSKLQLRPRKSEIKESDLTFDTIHFVFVACASMNKEELMILEDRTQQQGQVIEVASIGSRIFEMEVCESVNEKCAVKTDAPYSA